MDFVLGGVFFLGDESVDGLVLGVHQPIFGGGSILGGHFKGCGGGFRFIVIGINSTRGLCGR